MRGFNAVRAAVAVLGIMAFASGAWAQVGSEGKDLPAGQWTGQRVMGVAADSSQHLLRVDANGNFNAADPSRDRDLDWKHLDIINGALAPGAAAISSAKDTRGWERSGLVIYVSPQSTTYLVTLAVQIRGGYVAASDSLSSFPWPMWNTTSTFADTLGSRADSTSTTDVSGFPTVNVVDNEFIVQIRLKASGSSGTTNHSVFIPLCRNGVWWSAPYTTVRVRPLNPRIASLAAPGNTALSQTIRCDLVGWR